MKATIDNKTYDLRELPGLEEDEKYGVLNRWALSHNGVYAGKLEQWKSKINTQYAYFPVKKGTVNLALFDRMLSEDEVEFTA